MDAMISETEDIVDMRIVVPLGSSGCSDHVGSLALCLAAECSGRGLA
ncbi:MAG: hypothetical protein ONB31_12530 [candidate division KSB1 bacterium]|nr:hypothetical protein [candidate division KSB1 bacterium]MDZ7334496.1 hypothetical protein [candidate division KSB1 bacterium]MDZ7357957.1 hypothetical protein [candidate division KSB1 bacterium]MDZ7400995.1 hypothetical protein [candidate division KSB1 bacterium]